jgi:conjugative relaxase-like TrwC/TraI family protein
MLNLKPIGPSVAGYYLDARAGGPGRWLGSGASALGLEGPVGAADLTAVLQGRHPVTGRYLPDRRPARRRAGWDLVFSAPKSVSLLGALAIGGRETVEAAHRGAVGEALSHLAHQLVPDRPMVAAAFDHRTNAASEPHVHTHVLLANLSPAQGRGWRRYGNDWWPDRQALSALYQLGLRHHLAASGWDLHWRLRPDGLADLADVPRAAVRATSTQRASTVTAGRFETRRSAMPQPWRRRAIDAGMAAPARSPSGPAPGPPALPAPESPDGQSLSGLVAARLAGRRSDFRRTDVIRALATTWPAGATAAEAAAWADQFCRQAVPLGRTTPTRGPRWTTHLARQADHRLAHSAAGAELQILNSPPGESRLLAHASAIGAWRQDWADAGLRVKVKVPTELAAHRWRALTGVDASPRSGRVDLVIVDQADRRSSPELLALLAEVFQGRARGLLVEGGTLPRLSQPDSRGLMDVGAQLRRFHPPVGHPTATIPPVLTQVAQEWACHPEALMVGLGVDEARFLNLAARRHLADHRELAGPGLTVGRRLFQAGDRVIAMGRLAPDVPTGHLGRVLEVRPGRRQVVVARGAHRVDVLDRSAARHLGYGYALTPALARWTREPLVLLGSPDAVPRLRDRVVHSLSAARRRPHSGPGAAGRDLTV